MFIPNVEEIKEIGGGPGRDIVSGDDDGVYSLDY